MPLKPLSHQKSRSPLSAYLIELVIYGVFVTVYLFAVYHLLNDWLKHLSQRQPDLYAVVSILLIVLQSIGLQQLTSFLLRTTKRL